MKEISTIKEEWNNIISAKLKEGVRLSDLSHEYAPGIIMEPNIIKDDIQSYDHSVDIQQPWINMASIAGGTSTEKNVTILKALMEGANGLSILLDKHDDISLILKEVLTEYLEVRIDGNQLSKEELNHQRASLDEGKFPNVRWMHSETSNKTYTIPTDQRVEGIQHMLKQIGNAWHTDIIVHLSKNMLFEIASLRAIRALVQEQGIKSFSIIGTYTIEGTNELGDYNLIEKTYKIMSGILGGSDAVLTNYVGDEDSRLTLNVHNILDLESGMKNVMDPLKGSYYLEKLTGEIIKQVKS